MRKIYVVPHTHWDKEWYFSTKDSFVLLDQVFKNVIEFLENDPNLTFCMDGQSSIVNEFLEINPEYKERIKKLADNNQLELGPWFTQTDCLNVDGENIIRNLVYGIYKTNQLSKHMKIAYLPDTFGFNAQMPLICNHVGITNFIFRRGGEYGDGKLSDPLFLWKSKDGSVVNTVHIIKGYDLGAKFSDDKDYIINNATNNIDRISNLTKTEKILFPTGNDQLNLNGNLFKLVANANNHTDDEYNISTYTKYFEDNKDYFKDEYIGDLRFPNYDRVHLTIGSVRADIKQFNWKLEQKIFNKVEPLMVLARDFNINISTLLLYKAWEKIFDSAAHDAMGGCVTDPVHENIIARYKEAEEILDGIENTITNKIAQKLNLNDNQLIIFNLKPKAFVGFKQVEYFAENQNTILKEAKTNSVIEKITYSAEENELINNDDVYYLIKSQVEVALPAFGYKIFNLVDGNLYNEKLNSIINDNLKIYIENKKLVCKTNNKVMEDFINFIDVGNDGDTYDFSPPPKDMVINSKLTSWTFTKLDSVKVADLTYELLLPKDLQNRAEGKAEINQIINVRLLVFEDNRIKVKIKFKNQVLSHRLSIVFNLNTKIDKIKNSVPFGIHELSCPEQLNLVNENYIEYDVKNFVFDQFVSVELAKGNYFTLVSHGSKELYVEKEKMIVPLISTTGEFGKSNLLYRPGRASGDTSKKGHIMLFTKNAQLLGENNFSFDIYFNKQAINEYQVYKINENIWDTVFYQWQMFNKFHYRLDNKIQVTEPVTIDKEDYSSFTIDGDVQIKTITPSLYDKSAFLIRMYNPFDKNQPFILSKYLKYEVVNAIEEKSSTQELVVKAFGLLTLKVWRD